MHNDDLQVILSDIFSAAKFNMEHGNYLLTASYKGGRKDKYYTNQPTEAMHRILSDYKKTFNAAYEIAKGKIWPFAWRVATENFRIVRALSRMDEAREMATDEKWGK